MRTIEEFMLEASDFAIEKFDKDRPPSLLRTGMPGRKEFRMGAHRTVAHQPTIQVWELRVGTELFADIEFTQDDRVLTVSPMFDGIVPVGMIVSITDPMTIIEQGLEHSLDLAVHHTFATGGLKRVRLACTFHDAVHAPFIGMMVRIARAAKARK